MNWHTRYTQQAQWTRELRRHAYRLFGFTHLKRILEVGCGTGAILTELPALTPAACFGLDISIPALAIAADQTGAILCCGDAHRLPYRTGAFDAVYCHFTLLWLEDPSQALREMVRVTRLGGAVLALAEPDYGGRIDFPPEFETLGAAQLEALTRQGANPGIGRQLSALLHGCGLAQVETGVLAGSWKQPPSQDEFELEWQVLAADLQDSQLDLHRLKAMDQTAWAEGRRTLFVPTFYGWGVKR